MGLNSIPAFDRMERQAKLAGKIILTILVVGGLVGLIWWAL